MRHASIDGVRGFAILAMIAAHTMVFVRGQTPYALDIGFDLLNDVASPLFALIIGVTVGMGTRDVIAPRWTIAERRRFLLSWVLKALALIALGWLLDLRTSGAIIVLDYLGATMLVAATLLFLRTRTVTFAFAVVAAIGPALNAAARDSEWAVTASGVTETVLDWTVLGSAYRVTGLLPLLLLGLILARWQLGDARRTALVLAAGVVLAPLGHAATALEARRGTAYSGSWPDLVRDVGLSLTAYGAIVVVMDHAAPAVRAAAARLLRPLIDMGTMALTIYALHIAVLMAIWETTLPYDADRLAGGIGWLVMFGLLAGCAGFAMAWRRWLGPGPLERVVGVLSLRHPPRSLVTIRRPPGLGRRPLTIGERSGEHFWSDFR